MHLPTGCHMADSEFSIIFSRIQPRCSLFTFFVISYHVTKFYFNQFLAPYSTISPHLTTLSPHSSNTAHPDSLKNNGLKRSTTSGNDVWSSLRLRELQTSFPDVVDRLS